LQAFSAILHKAKNGTNAIMRLVLAFAALAAALFFNIPLGQAQSGNGPWCAVVNTGFNNVSEICDFRTLEECRPFVLAGNRGFCNENPRWVDSHPSAGKPQKHRKRHVNPD
jgi:Protein of unknown function (DUF3551)